MEAIQLMQETPDQAVDAHMEWAEVTDRAESEAALESYLEFVEEDLVVGEQPWLDMRDVLAETNPAVADVDVTEAYTTQFVEQLDEMGFLEQLGVQIER